MATIVETSRLFVERGGQSVVKDLTFALEAQKILALIGGNGAGKSTTLLALLGLLPISSGGARVLGHNVRTEASNIRTKTGYLPELAALYDHLSALENARYFLGVAGMAVPEEAILEVFRQVKLPERAWDTRAETFSKGMRQKVAIATCLLRQTDLILFDEPTSGLDPAAIDEFHTVIDDLKSQGTSILMVTHDLFGACETADDILLLRGGKLVGEFARGQAGFDQDAMRAAFKQDAS